MLKTITIVVVVLIAALLGFAATKPDTFRVQRATSIKAPPEKIFALINDLHSWGAWSPYEKKDSAMKRTHSGAANGKGAVYEWDGNNEVGKGRMEITETSPPSKVAIQLDFVKPINVYRSQYAGTNKATAVTWTVGDVEDVVRALKAKGVVFEHYDMPDMTRESDIHVAGDMKVAWFKDPDGNILNIVNR